MNENCVSSHVQPVHSITTTASSDSSPSAHTKSFQSSSLSNCDPTNAGESDADSGIVTATNDKRIGSTSSNSDEDQSGHELSPTKSHSENKKTQIPLNNLHRVRFDDELEMSEQNIRRSCRRLFATLYNPTVAQTQTLDRNHQTLDRNHQTLDRNHHTLDRNHHTLDRNHQPIIRQQTGQSYCQNSHNLTNCNANSSCSLLPSCHCNQFSSSTLPRKMWQKNNLNTNLPNYHFANSDMNLNKKLEIPKHHFNDLLLKTVDQSDSQRNLLGQNLPEMKLLDPSRLKSKSCWTINNEATNCPALDSIQTMSDSFESASLLHAFAKPIIISSNHSKYEKRRLNEEPRYETIYPRNEKAKENVKLSYNENIETKTELSTPEKKETKLLEKQSATKTSSNCKIENCSHKQYVITTYSNQQNIPTPLGGTTSKSIASLLTTETNQILNQPTKSILRNSSLKKQSSLKNLNYGLPPDQMYPSDYGFSFIDSDSYEKSAEYARVNKSKKNSEKFSNSYSAGDIGPIIPPKSLITQSELNLHRFGQNVNIDKSEKRSFLQRFRSAFSRAFTSEKTLIKQQNLTKSDLVLNRSPNRTKIDVNVNKSPFSKSPSNFIMKSFRMSMRRNIKVNVEKNNERKLRWKDQSSLTPESSPERSTNKDELVWGELIKIHSNGSQVVQIHRQQGKPFGFFVAKGTVNNRKGVFVSRMRDEIIQKSLAGVLEIGDEILFIGNENVKDSNIMHINELIANKDKIMLTIMPYVNYQKCL